MTNNKIIVKTKEERKIMREGGKKLSRIKSELKKQIRKGKGADDIEKLANKLIEKENGKPSFKMVPGYSWATCVNVNQGVVHGIPHKSIKFKNGDIVSVDVGIYYKGFHTDTSFTLQVGFNKESEHFLNVGKAALEKAIEKAKPGMRVYDISKSIQEAIEKAGYSPIRALVGHGIGKKLHEAPQIPCFVKGSKNESPEIVDGATFAIEVMYAEGSANIKIEADGWTISTHDGKISALFEETVEVTKKGPLVLTR